MFIVWLCMGEGCRHWKRNHDTLAIMKRNDEGRWQYFKRCEMLTNVFVTWSGMSEGCGRWHRNHDTLASMLLGKSMMLWETNRAPALLHMSNTLL